MKFATSVQGRCVDATVVCAWWEMSKGVEDGIVDERLGQPGAEQTGKLLTVAK